MTPEPAVMVHQLSYTYPGGRVALEDVSFTLGPGERVGLIGPNGAGKTSLFLCLTGVLPPGSGRIIVSGLDVRDPGQRKRLPSSVGIVFQDSDDQLFNASVGEDVAFGPLNLGLTPDEVQQRVSESLAQVGLTGHEGRVPFHLSGGEKRRVALAGVLAMRPAVLLLDEPTMFLDPRGRRDLVALMPGLPGTKLIATHDIEFIVATCPRVLLLDAGRLVADGPTHTICADTVLMESHGLEVPWSLRRA